MGVQNKIELTDKIDITGLIQFLGTKKNALPECNSDQIGSFRVSEEDSKLVYCDGAGVWLPMNFADSYTGGDCCPTKDTSFTFSQANEKTQSFMSFETCSNEFKGSVLNDNEEFSSDAQNQRCHEWTTNWDFGGLSQSQFDGFIDLDALDRSPHNSLFPLPSGDVLLVQSVNWEGYHKVLSIDSNAKKDDHDDEPEIYKDAQCDNFIKAECDGKTVIDAACLETLRNQDYEVSVTPALISCYDDTGNSFGEKFLGNSIFEQMGDEFYIRIQSAPGLDTSVEINGEEFEGAAVYCPFDAAEWGSFDQGDLTFSTIPEDDLPDCVIIPSGFSPSVRFTTIEDKADPVRRSIKTFTDIEYWSGILPAQSFDYTHFQYVEDEGTPNEQQPVSVLGLVGVAATKNLQVDHLSFMYCTDWNCFKTPETFDVPVPSRVYFPDTAEVGDSVPSDPSGALKPFIISGLYGKPAFSYVKYASCIDQTSSTISDFGTTCAPSIVIVQCARSDCNEDNNIVKNRFHEFTAVELGGYSRIFSYNLIEVRECFNIDGKETPCDSTNSINAYLVVNGLWNDQPEIRVFPLSFQRTRDVNIISGKNSGYSIPEQQAGWGFFPQSLSILEDVLEELDDLQVNWLCALSPNACRKTSAVPIQTYIDGDHKPHVVGLSTQIDQFIPSTLAYNSPSRGANEIVDCACLDPSCASHICHTIFSTNDVYTKAQFTSAGELSELFDCFLDNYSKDSIPDACAYYGNGIYKDNYPDFLDPTFLGSRSLEIASFQANYSPYTQNGVISVQVETSSGISSPEIFFCLDSTCSERSWTVSTGYLESSHRDEAFTSAWTVTEPKYDNKRDGHFDPNHAQIVMMAPSPNEWQNFPNFEKYYFKYNSPSYEGLACSLETSGQMINHKGDLFVCSKQPTTETNIDANLLDNIGSSTVWGWFRITQSIANSLDFHPQPVTSAYSSAIWSQILDNACPCDSPCQVHTPEGLSLYKIVAKPNWQQYAATDIELPPNQLYYELSIPTKWPSGLNQVGDMPKPIAITVERKGTNPSCTDSPPTEAEQGCPIFIIDDPAVQEENICYSLNDRSLAQAISDNTFDNQFNWRYYNDRCNDADINNDLCYRVEVEENLPTGVCYPDHFTDDEAAFRMYFDEFTSDTIRLVIEQDARETIEYKVRWIYESADVPQNFNCGEVADE